MDEYSRRTFIRTTLPGFLGVAMTLPALNASWCYVAGIYAMKNPLAFGTPAAAAAIVHFGLAVDNGLWRKISHREMGDHRSIRSQIGPKTLDDIGPDVHAY